MKRSIQACKVNKLKPSPEVKAVQYLMDISDEDYKLLKRDIEESKEIRDPLKVYMKKKEYLILGGLTRWKVARELKFDTVPIEIYNDLSPEERKALVINDNLSRRHISNKQKEKFIEYFLNEFPSKSNRAIADILKVSHHTVQKKRKEMESGGQIAQVPIREGLDGKKYTKKEKPLTQITQKISVNNQKPRGKLDMPGSFIVKVAGIFDELCPKMTTRESATAFGLLIENYLSRLSDKDPAIKEAGRIISKFRKY